MSEPDFSRLGQLVRGRRLDLGGMTQAEAARLAGVSDTTWSGVEAGKPVSARTLRGIDRALGWAPGSAETALQGIRLSSDQRQALLAQTIASQVATGLRVESQGPYNAILVKGKPVNHILHLILTNVTAGLWLLVWIPVAIFGGEKRSQVTVDDFGNTSVQRLT